MNAKITIYDTEFDVAGDKLTIKCNQIKNFNIRNNKFFCDLKKNSIYINDFVIYENNNTIEISHSDSASINIIYNIQPIVPQIQNPLLSQNNNISLKVDEVPVSKIIEANRKAKRERMRNFGVNYYESVDNLSNQDKEDILNGNLKLMKANNELLHLLNKSHYNLNSRSNKDSCDLFIKTTDDKITKQQCNTMEELMEINKENLKLFAKYEELNKLNINKKATQEKIVKPVRKSCYSRAPFGFVKPAQISDQLAVFLGRSIGTQMSRVDVTKEINAYIRTNSLQNKENGRKIDGDEKLRNLLKLKPTDELTYFNLQKYIAPHFKKST